MPFPFATYTQPYLPAHVTTVRQEPCPLCRKTEFYFNEGVAVCTTCRVSRKVAEDVLAAGAIRDANGSLLCDSCKDPFPYATTDEYNRFVCRSCKSYGDM